MLNEFDGQLHALTAEVMNYGHFKQSRTGHGTYMLPAQMMRFNLGGLRMPILSSRLVRYINSIHEMDMFKTGSPQLKPLCDKKIGIWDSWFIPGSAVYAEPKFEELLMDERAQLAIDAGLYEEINQFIAGIKERDPGIGSFHIHFTLNGVRSGWLNLNRSLWIAVGKKFDEHQIPNTRQVQDGEEVSLKKRLSRVSKNDGVKWNVIFPRLVAGQYPEPDEGEDRVIGVEVVGFDPNAEEFVKFNLNPEAVPAVVKVLDDLQVPKYRLLDASIGEGSYGVQWRKWQDTQLVDGKDLSLMQAYRDQGYTNLGQLQEGIGWDSGRNVMHREIDQLQNIIDMLKSNPDDRRMIMTAWNPARTWQAALPPCFSAGTLVATPLGYVPIETIQIGDLVHTATGQVSAVDKLWITPYKGAMRRIKALYAGPKIECTPNHPFLVKGRGYVDAKDLVKGDYLGIPKTKSVGDYTFTTTLNHGDGRTLTKTIELTNDDYFTLGYFAGNGWASRNTSNISFAIPHSKVAEILPRIRKTIKVSRKPGEAPNVSTYETRNETWIGTFREFGYRAHNKRIPQWVMESTVEAKRAFIEGFLEADGYVGPRGVVTVTSTSASLVYGLQRLLAELDQHAGVAFRKKSSTHVIEGRTVNQRNLWILNYRPAINAPRAHMDDDYMWVPIISIEDYESEENVYNLSVEGEHTYLVQNLANHNCHLYFQVVSWEMSHSELENMLENRGLFQDFLNRHRDEQGRLNEDIFSDKEEALKLMMDYIKENELPTRALAGFVLLRSFN